MLLLRDYYWESSMTYHQSNKRKKENFIMEKSTELTVTEASEFAKKTELIAKRILRVDNMAFQKKLEGEVQQYRGLVYTEETIGDARKIVAELRKKKDEHEDNRVKRCRPYREALSKVKETVDEAINNTYVVVIDEIQKQIDEVEKQRIAERKRYINETYKRIFGDSKIALSKIQNKKWINKGTSAKMILTELQQKYLQLYNDEQTLRMLAEGPFLDDVLDHFYDTLSLTGSIAKLQELKAIEQKVMAVQESKKETMQPRKSVNAEVVSRPKKSSSTGAVSQKKMVMSFRLRGKEEELKAVKAFIQEHNIEVLS